MNDDMEIKGTYDIRCSGGTVVAGTHYGASKFVRFEGMGGIRQSMVRLMFIGGIEWDDNNVTIYSVRDVEKFIECLSLSYNEYDNWEFDVDYAEVNKPKTVKK